MAREPKFAKLGAQLADLHIAAVATWDTLWDFLSMTGSR